MGVALYNAHGKNALLKEVFKQGESEYRKEKLNKALLELLQHAPANASTKTATGIQPKNADKIYPKKADKKDPQPSNNERYKDKWLPFYAEMKSLCHKLRDFPTDEQRGRAALRILELEDACIVWWDKEDYLIRNGVEMPEASMKPITAVQDMNQLEHQLRNARSNVSRYKGKPSKKHLYERAVQKVKEIEAKIPRLRNHEQTEATT